MGLGYALSEDFPCTGGVPDSLLLRDLGILKAADTPPVEVILVEVPDGARGEWDEAAELFIRYKREAMAAAGPFVVDVRIDASEPSPLLKRFESLIKQGNSKNVAGWEK